MTLSEPIWRVRTRPCPFYQQGHCLFAGSCNFLHTIPSKIAVDVNVYEIPGKGATQPSTPSPANAPTISVESPQSARSPRSPRLSGLLLALRDVIGDDPEEEPVFGLAAQDISSPTVDSWSVNSSTLLNDSIPDVGADSTLKNSTSSFPTPHMTPHQIPPANPSLHSHSFVPDSQIDNEVDSDSGNLSFPKFDTNPENDTLYMNPSGSFIQPSIYTNNSPPVEEQGEEEYVEPGYAITRDDLLSPVEISQLQLTNFAGASTDMTECVTDADVPWRPSAPLGVPSPRSPARGSTFGLLTSPFSSPSARVLSPRLSAFIGRHPTIVADEEERGARDSDLDSPQAQIYLPVANTSETEKQEKKQEYETAEETEITKQNNQGERRQEMIYDDEEEEEELSFSSESQWDAEMGDTAVYIGKRQSAQQEVQSAIRRSSHTPTHFLTSGQIEFLEEETTANSSIEVTRNTPDNVPPENSTTEPPSNSGTQPLLERSPSPEDQVAHDVLEAPTPGSIDETFTSEADSEAIETDTRTARLAYLECSEDQAEETRSLRSLYEAYSTFPSPSQEPVLSAEDREFHSTDVLPEESSSISTPSSLVRERVFTPPSPDRQIRAMRDSPSHAQSPIPPRYSPPMLSSGLNASFDIRSERKDAPGNLDEPTGASKKVPFSWRKSSVSQTRSNKSGRASRISVRPIVEPLRSPPPADDPPSLSSSPSSPVSQTSRLKPLRLSTLLGSRSSRSVPSHISTHIQHQTEINPRISTSTSSVSSSNLMSRNASLSSTRFPPLSDRIRNHLNSSDSHIPSPLTSDNLQQLSNFGPPLSAPLTGSHIWRRASIYSQDEYPRAPSRLSEPSFRPIDEENDEIHAPEYDDEHLHRHILPPSLPTPPYSASVVQPTREPIPRQPAHAIATPKPNLIFAIASDDVSEVKRVLENGDASPNEAVGPQTALEFALTNDQLTNRTEIVKTLLSYGADPAVLKQVPAPHRTQNATFGDVREDPAKSLIDDIDPVLKYYVQRADAPNTRRTSALMNRSAFRPLTRVRYELVGQDCVLEQLFRVLSMQSRGFSVAPIVVLLCGPSGHGKSLLARKFGSLLDVPTHTVNMTTLRSTHDLWRSHSMSPYETPTTCTLAEFLINNEGKRCVVVLDEIEKTDEKTLWSLLMPWELGRCSFEAGSRHIDVRNVVWLGTSNIGHDLVFQHHEARARQHDLMARDEYLELMGLLRPLVSERLGTSVLSRVTSVLPFVPFTHDEKTAICWEALNSLGGEDVRSLSAQEVETVIRNALASYCPAEGARSLYRAVSNQLIDII